MMRTIPLACVLLTVAVLTGPLHSAEDANCCPRVPTLTVSGQAEVRSAPDLARLRLGATAQSENASDAQQRVAEIMQKAIAAVRELGVPEADLQTASLQLHPVYSQPPPEPRNQPYEPKIVGYRASNVVSVRLTDLSKVGDVIDAAVTAGANELQELSFELEDETAARQEALRRAVASARAKAQTIAEAMNVQLAGVLDVREGGVSVQPVERLGRQRLYAAEMDASTPVQPGQVTVSASVTIEYRIGEEQVQE